MTPPLLYPHRGGALVADDNAGFEEGRVYEWKGHLLDSVTSIISQGVPKGEALTRWSARVAAEFAVANLGGIAEMEPTDAEKLIAAAPFKKRDDAAELGSNVHDYAEALVLGLPVPELSYEGERKAALFRKFLAEYRPAFEAAECWVYNLGHQYAGRFDAIAVIDGTTLLIDYKTGKRAYPEVGLQLAALRNAEFVGLADGSEVDMPHVDGCAVLQIGASKYELQRVRAEEADYMAFRYAQQVAHWRKTSIDVLGSRIFPASRIPPRPSAPVNVASMLD